MTDTRDTMEYINWINKIDQLLEDEIGLSHQDLGDYLYMDAFLAGDSAEATVRNILEQEGY